MHLHELENGKKIMDCPLEMGSIFGISGKRDHKELFFGFTSLLKPTTIYRIDFSDGPMQVSVSFNIWAILLQYYYAYVIALRCITRQSWVTSTLTTM